MTRISCFFVAAAISLLVGQSSSLVTGDLVPSVVTTLEPVPLVEGLVNHLLAGNSEPDKEDTGLDSIVIPGKRKRDLNRINSSLQRRQRAFLLGILGELSGSSAPTTTATPTQVSAKPARHKQAIPGTETASAVLSQLQSSKTTDASAPAAVASSVAVTPRPASSTVVAKPAPSTSAVEIPQYPLDDSTVESHAIAEDASPPIHVLPSFLSSSMPGVSTLPAKNTSSSATKASRAKRHVPTTVITEVAPIPPSIQSTLSSRPHRQSHSHHKTHLKPHLRQ
ncbi:hypothetical protein PTTG_28414 [Puccinia triticina 1-1 BBBD Race 1]|uniref:Uncharacterized protein n=1 Tax=Puccinia triticina (isolate 1-1 / race 1 (BBBD)) TaxID=630390 RepID=A0A180GBW5_PUCT1|nr:hypothetical protein PTTG_28414 [Puccinia triticina 1-1 BBBD Race 1]WAR54783.1 hypothetical protein PtB15_4B401 [Puccinia triticina]